MRGHGTFVRIRSTWTLLSGLGMLIGAALALWIFPGAAAGQNPVGQYGFHVFGFAVLIGIGLGVGQAAGLDLVLGLNPGDHPPIERRSLTFMWVPASILGVMAMLLPLWAVNILDILVMPFIALALMLPGLVVLALAQWGVIRRTGLVLWSWLTRTVLGGLAGTVIGIALYIGLFLAAARGFGVLVPLDLVGACTIGVGIGWAQAPPLESTILGQSTR